MNNLNFLWAAVSVVWFITLFYVVSLVRRQNRLQHEIDVLRASLDEAAGERQQTFI